jgi:threonine dehydratase
VTGLSKCYKNASGYSSGTLKKLIVLLLYTGYTITKYSLFVNQSKGSFMDNLLSSALSLSDIFSAKKIVTQYCLPTPTILSDSLSTHIGGNVYLKLEILQKTGAFKVRGASNKLARLSRDEKERGVVTASTGNHGRAVAYIARQMGIPATVCISQDVPENKVIAIRALGADVDIFGHSQDEAFSTGRTAPTAAWENHGSSL